MTVVASMPMDVASYAEPKAGSRAEEVSAPRRSILLPSRLYLMHKLWHWLPLVSKLKTNTIFPRTLNGHGMANSCISFSPGQSPPSSRFLKTLILNIYT